MKWSLLIGKISGIKLYVHWTFFILIAWIFFIQLQKNHNWQQAAIGVLFILILFFCVTLHEFGHALVAKRFHYLTERITLLPIGGVAQLSQLPEKPSQELWVALAGPLVNIAIAAVLLVVLWATGGLPDHYSLTYIGNGNFLYAILVANITLAVFNLIPAFPMDGGRVLRALLALKSDRAKATRAAAIIGQLFAIGFVILGLYANFWLALIGVFIFFGAGGEAALEKQRARLAGLKVKNGMVTKALLNNKWYSYGLIK